MSKEKPVKMNEGSTGADAEVDMEELDIKDHTRLKPPRTLETTLFDRLEKLYGEGIKRVLKIQYRCVQAHSFSSFRLPILTDRQNERKYRHIPL